ncbi:haloacid dehalogenase [Sphingomonas spermidinifaciens]|uniref:Haloacid dehalogenase n=1 Tax=Sphingomonas spermidinifaciens TaxID=1141889 RepID=A0A2A4B1I4_9SPHN|nr:HAD family phosphatase [Sphingomonas spermidinifaciens]PCD01930.1 haloacid dehalogenase [Sphingomonas spermidinifaciens]
MKYAGLIFDFDGVLVESEYEGNRHLAEYLTRIGHAHTPAEAMQHYMGLSGRGFIDAIEGRIGRTLPADFHAEREIENERVLAEGIGEVVGAVAFVRSLPPELPRAIASSSSTHWIRTHLRHLGLEDAFGEHVYSGKEHVARGKPAPDLYLHAAAAIGVSIGACAIIEDSPVGATGAVASGAHVIGLCAGTHCPPDHAAVLRAIGVHDIAADFSEVARLVGL